MLRITICIFLAVLSALAQAPSSNARKLSGKPICTATVKTNCIPNADGAGIVSIGNTLLPIPVNIATASPVSPTVTSFQVCDVAGGCTYNLPAITTAIVGLQVCVWNKVGRTGAITFQLPAATQMDVDGTNGTAAATFASSGAAGDMACVIAQAPGQYKGLKNKGTWTNN